MSWIHSIDLWRKLKSHHRNLFHNLPQTCGGRKSVCLIWILPREIFLTHPSTIFSINERWSIKFNKHNSTINKRSLERITWRIFWINKINPVMQTSMNTQPSPSPKYSTNLRGNKIPMSNLYAAHRKIATQLNKRFRISECFSDQRKQTCQQSTMQRWNLKLQRTILQNEMSWGS